MSPLAKEERQILAAMLTLGDRDSDFLMGRRMISDSTGIRFDLRLLGFLDQLVERELLNRFEDADNGILYGVRRHQAELALAREEDVPLPHVAPLGPRCRASGLAERLVAA